MDSTGNAAWPRFLVYDRQGGAPYEVSAVSVHELLKALLPGRPAALSAYSTERRQWEAADSLLPRDCRKCGYPIERSGTAWTAISGDTADGLSYCPPDPDAARHGVHQPRKR